MTQYTPKAAIPYAELTDAANLQTFSQGLATVLDSAVVPVYPARTDRDAANPSPSTGDVCFVTADLREYRYYGGQWNNQTPVKGVEVVSFTSQTSVFVTVTYAIPFEIAPLALCTIDSGSGSTAGWIMRSDQFTTTSFRFNVFSTGGVSSTWSSISVRWVAY